MTVRGDSSFNMNPYTWTSGPETSDFFAKVANIDLTQVEKENDDRSVQAGEVAKKPRAKKARKYLCNLKLRK